MNKRKKPMLIEALEKHIAREKTSMHMPGHKGGKGFSRSFQEQVLCFDATEVPGLDNLHNPGNVILDSMNACAQAFGAIHTFFLVNGSTSGIHAMLLSCFQRGDKLLVGRNCHSSVIHGLILFGIQPVYVMPGYHEEYKLTVPATLQAWEKALEENRDVKGALVTSPDYFGLCAPILELAQLMHASGKLLLVDEAHGSHFAFYREFPPGALQQGADMCVQSFHKTLPALTQAAVLHVGSERVDFHRVKKSVSMLTTTSPSYMVMASIDYARDFVENEGHEQYERLSRMLTMMKQHLSEMKKLRLVPDQLGVIQRDPTRIVIDSSQTDTSGFTLYKQMQEEFGIVAEMADEYHVVCIVTIADTEKELNRLQLCLKTLDSKVKKGIKKYCKYQLIYPESCIIPEPADFLEGNIKMPLSKAEGYVNMGLVTPYPPGIPVLGPGERVMKEHIEYLYRLYTNGSDIHGLSLESGKLMITVTERGRKGKGDLCE